MSKIDYADMPANVEKYSSAPQPTTLENPAVADGQKPEAGSCPSENPNNDAPRNGVAPTQEADSCPSDAPVTRCTDAPISEVASCPSENPNNDAPCNGVRFFADCAAKKWPLPGQQEPGNHSAG